MTTALTRTAVVQRIEQSGVIAVVRLTDGQAGRHLAAALIDGGVSAIEITMTVPRAIELIEDLSDAFPDALIGAGTVTDPRTARDVINAGAKFVVGPAFRPPMIEACLERDVPVMPGCFSPTEILAAWELGADIIKIFPSAALGPGFIKDLRGPFPSIKMMPTGSVTRDNTADWIRAGAVAVGASSALVDPKAIQAGRFDVITGNARAFIAAVRSAR
jgi:2-dehydro-3-deoxyphosphogluconate aldolase/(4S)-4-hydroxy-2-oxoglutarate aldolase